MPQLVPFYFLNQLTYGLLLMYLMLVLVSTKMLPYMMELYIMRMTMSKL
ncbi:unnamed protein product (mitochondrion) [Komagataella phaffii CBS 7435]|uniref:ATP synthase protein 8 n=1 Tax=Komagataella phaffii (strain ATCC 76273 / CBS 7435 / CECT 11047 / NRRL Y-11430 / Wegner 21-1) TaxID=981350 RepID=F2R0K9_KOMPC|nr:unnamed protein product [Komagataella phaffii CBS 7435]